MEGDLCHSYGATGTIHDHHCAIHDHHHCAIHDHHHISSASTITGDGVSVNEANSVVEFGRHQYHYSSEPSAWETWKCAILCFFALCGLGVCTVGTGVFLGVFAYYKWSSAVDHL